MYIHNLKLELKFLKLKNPSIINENVGYFSYLREFTIDKMPGKFYTKNSLKYFNDTLPIFTVINALHLQ